MGVTVNQPYSGNQPDTAADHNTSLTQMTSLAQSHTHDGGDNSQGAGGLIPLAGMNHPSYAAIKAAGASASGLSGIAADPNETPLDPTRAFNSGYGPAGNFGRLYGWANKMVGANYLGTASNSISAVASTGSHAVTLTTSVATSAVTTSTLITVDTGGNLETVTPSAVTIVGGLVTGFTATFTKTHSASTPITYSAGWQNFSGSMVLANQVVNGTLGVTGTLTGKQLQASANDGTTIPLVVDPAQASIVSPYLNADSVHGYLPATIYGTVVTPSAAASVGTTATLSFGSAHGLYNGQTVTVAGMTPTGYNGTYTITTTGPSASSFTYTTVGSSIGPGTVMGTVTFVPGSGVTGGGLLPKLNANGLLPLIALDYAAVESLTPPGSPVAGVDTLYSYTLPRMWQWMDSVSKAATLAGWPNAPAALVTTETINGSGGSTVLHGGITHNAGAGIDLTVAGSTATHTNIGVRGLSIGGVTAANAVVPIVQDAGALVYFDGSNQLHIGVSAGSLPATSNVLTLSDAYGGLNWIISGVVPNAGAVGALLATGVAITSGVGYFPGGTPSTRVAIPGMTVTSASIPALSATAGDNYVDVDATGTYFVTRVAAGAGLTVPYSNESTLASGRARVARITTDGANITAVANLGSPFINNQSTPLASPPLSPNYFGTPNTPTFAYEQDIRAHPDLVTALGRIGTTTTTLVISIPTTDAVGVTVPFNVSLRFTGNGSINPTTGKTTTINGPIWCPQRVTIFGGAGTVVLGQVGTPIVSPHWWGAVGNGTTDDSAAFQAALNAFKNTAGGTIQCLPLNYFIGSRLVWPNLNPLNTIGSTQSSQPHIRLTGTNSRTGIEGTRLYLGYQTANANSATASGPFTAGTSPVITLTGTAVPQGSFDIGTPITITDGTNQETTPVTAIGLSGSTITTVTVALSLSYASGTNNLTIKWPMTNDAKLVSLGQGDVEIDHMTLYAAGSGGTATSNDVTPFILLTSSRPDVHHNKFIGWRGVASAPNTLGIATNQWPTQSGIILGGSGARGDNSFSGGYSGYIGRVYGNLFNNINHAVIGQTFLTTTDIAGNYVNSNCGSDKGIGAAFAFWTSSTVFSNTVSLRDNQLETVNYQQVVYLGKNVVTFTIEGNQFPDNLAATPVSGNTSLNAPTILTVGYLPPTTAAPYLTSYWWALDTLAKTELVKFSASSPTGNTTCSAITAGATSIVVSSATGISAGTGLLIDSGAGYGVQEPAIVASTYSPGSTTVPLTATLIRNHSGTPTVQVGPFTNTISACKSANSTAAASTVTTQSHTGCSIGPQIAGIVCANASTGHHISTTYYTGALPVWDQNILAGVYSPANNVSMPFGSGTSTTTQPTTHVGAQTQMGLLTTTAGITNSGRFIQDIAPNAVLTKTATIRHALTDSAGVDYLYLGERFSDGALSATMLAVNSDLWLEARGSQKAFGSTTPATATRSGTTLVTLTPTSMAGFVIGNLVKVAGMSVSDYNGTFVVANVFASTITYTALAAATDSATGGTAAPQSGTVANAIRIGSDQGAQVFVGTGGLSVGGATTVTSGNLSVSSGNMSVHGHYLATGTNPTTAIASPLKAGAGATVAMGTNSCDSCGQVTLTAGNTITAPAATTPTFGGSGSLSSGSYSWAWTAVSTEGAETTHGTLISATAAAGQQATLTIPTLPTGATTLKLYRTVVGGAGSFLYTGLSGSSGTLVDGVADGSLGVASPATNATAPAAGSLFTITFATAFGTAPFVVMGCNSGVTPQPNPINVTTTGFTVFLNLAPGAGQALIFTWIAMAKT